MKKIPKYLLFILCFGFICTTISFAQPSAKGGEQQSVVAATDPCPRPYGSATFTKVDATCNGTSTGSITILPTVGLVSDYTYKLHYSDPYVASNVFTNLKSGIYHGYALRTGGCVFRAGLITIADANPKLGATTSHTDVSTKGGSDGTITIAGTGGTGNYLYQLGSSGTPQPSGSFTGLKAGSYRLVVTDVAGCKPDYGTSVTIAQPSAKIGEQQSVAAATDPCPRPYGSATFTKVDATCTGTSTGSITILPTVGVVSDYTYKLHYSDPYVASNVFTNLKSGTYHGYALRTGGCVFRAGLITIANTNPTPLGATTSHTDVSTKGGSDGTITIAGTGGTGNYLYQLGSSGTPQPSGSFTGLKAGSYRLVVTDVAGCKPDYGTSVTIAQPSAKGGEHSSIVAASPCPSPQPYGSATFTPTDVTCPGLDDGGITIFPTVGSVGDYTYKILSSNSYSTSNVFTGLKAGTYHGYAKDASGCVFRTGPITLVNMRAPLGYVATPKDVTVRGGSDGEIKVTGIGGTLVYVFQLRTRGNPSAVGKGTTFTGLRAGDYRLIVNDAAGCKPSVGVTVTVDQPAAKDGNNQSKDINSINPELPLSGDKKIIIYPNPATDRFTLQLSNYKPGKAEIVMTNESGQIVERRSIDITSLQSNTVFGRDKKATGTYFVKVITAEGVQVSKVVMQDR